LKDEVQSVRFQAAEALGKLGDNRAAEPLITSLKDQDWEVRQWAAEGLGTLGDKRAVEPLTPLLKDQDENVRKVAAWALAKINSEQPGIQGSNSLPAPVSRRYPVTY
jgi:HEAT repeat protein